MQFRRKSVSAQDCWAACLSVRKAIAPILVFVLVTAAIAQHQKKGNQAYIKPILILYIFGTFAAAVVAVIASMAFPTTLILRAAGDVSVAPPSGIVEVLKTLLMNLVANPINALANANYIGILAWALVLGAALRHHGSDTTRQVAADLADTVSTVVKWIIRFAPLGIFGLVSSTIAETGFEALAGYMQLLAVLLGCMLFIALVVNPIIVDANPPQPFPAGVYLPARKRRVCLLYPFFRRQYPCEHGIGEKNWACTKTLTHLYSIGCNHQYGRCGNHHYRFGDGCGAHARHYG